VWRVGKEDRLDGRDTEEGRDWGIEREWNQRRVRHWLKEKDRKYQSR